MGLFRSVFWLGAMALVIIGLRKAVAQSGDKADALGQRIEGGDDSPHIVALVRIHDALHRRPHTNHDASPEAAKAPDDEA